MVLLCNGGTLHWKYISTLPVMIRRENKEKKDIVDVREELLTLSSYLLTFSSSSNFQKYPGRTKDFEKESILLLWMREAFGRRKLEVKGTSFSIIR